MEITNYLDRKNVLYSSTGNSLVSKECIIIYMLNRSIMYKKRK